MLRRVLRFDSHMREVVRLGTSGLVVRVFGTLLGFGVSVFVGRLLGAEGAGLYFFAVSVVNVASIFGRIGFGNVLVRYIAESATKREWGKGEFVYSAGVRLVSVVSGAIGLVIAASAPWAAKAVFHKPEYEIPLMLAGAAIVPFALVWIQGDALRGLREIPFAQVCKTVSVSLGTLILLYPFVRLWGANGAIASFLLAAIAAAIVGHRLWVKAWKKEAGSYGHPQSSMTTRSLLISSWALLGVALANMGIQNIASIMLGAFGSNVDVGTFNVASRVSNLLLIPLNGSISILAPKFVQLSTIGDMGNLAALVRRSSWLIIMIVVPVAGLVFAAAGPVMRIFGSHFSSGVPILRILMVGTVINAATGPVGTVLIMSGCEKTVWKLSVAMLVFGIGLCILGVLLYGVIGLSVALVVSVSVQNLVLVILVKRQLGFWPIGSVPAGASPSS